VVCSPFVKAPTLGPVCACVLLALAAACGAPERPGVPDRPGAAIAAPMPRPARARGVAAIEANAACEGCHVEIAAEWRASIHHGAAVDPVYLRGLSVEPEAFCRGCHAPEADPRAATPPPLAGLGIGCVTCHDTGEGILAAPGQGRAPHRVLRTAELATARACAGCHDFAFPGSPHAEKMQSTVTEADHAPARDRACASCHMPLVEGARGEHRRHDFRVAADRVRGAASVTVARAGTTVRVTLRPGAIGHAFPTGDMFRRLEIAAAATGADHAVLAEQVRYLTRHFGAARAGARAVLADDRVGLRGEEGTVVDLDLGPAAAGRVVEVRVAYQRVENPATNDQASAIVEDEIVLAEPALAPESP
jgi:Cytochrome c554 and c-prime